MRKALTFGGIGDTERAPKHCPSESQASPFKLVRRLRISASQHLRPPLTVSSLSASHHRFPRDFSSTLLVPSPPAIRSFPRNSTSVAYPLFVILVYRSEHLYSDASASHCPIPRSDISSIASPPDTLHRPRNHIDTFGLIFQRHHLVFRLIVSVTDFILPAVLVLLLYWIWL
jgi:hypothetical protein